MTHYKLCGDGELKNYSSKYDAFEDDSGIITRNVPIQHSTWNDDIALNVYYMHMSGNWHVCVLAQRRGRNVMREREHNRETNIKIEECG